MTAVGSPAGPGRSRGRPARPAGTGQAQSMHSSRHWAVTVGTDSVR
jgi:hypothetical protein